MIITAADEGRRADPSLPPTLARDRATIVGRRRRRARRASRGRSTRRSFSCGVSRSYGPGRYDPSYEEEGRDYPIGYVRWTERRLIAYFFEEVAAGRVRLGELVTHEFDDRARREQAYAALDSPGRMAILLRYPWPSEAAAPRRRADAGAGAARRAAAHRGRARSAPARSPARRCCRCCEDAGVELVAVAGTSPARAVGRRAGAGRPRTRRRDAAELLDDASIDVVVIATRHDSHAELAARALERGKGVFLEKPLAIDEAGLELVTSRSSRPAAGSWSTSTGALAPATERVTAHFAGRADPLYVDGPRERRVSAAPITGCATARRAAAG